MHARYSRPYFPFLAGSSITIQYRPEARPDDLLNGETEELGSSLSKSLSTAAIAVTYFSYLSTDSFPKDSNVCFVCS
jgi:hypothetical protein